MTVRRVVTGTSGGKSKFIFEGGTKRGKEFKNIPGQSAALLWSTPAQPTLPTDGADVINESSSYIPQKPGETRLMVVTFAPDSVLMSIDPVAGFQEFAEHIPDLAATMEPDIPVCTGPIGRLRHRSRRRTLARSMTARKFTSSLTTLSFRMAPVTLGETKATSPLKLHLS